MEGIKSVCRFISTRGCPIVPAPFVEKGLSAHCIAFAPLLRIS